MSSISGVPAAASPKPSAETVALRAKAFEAQTKAEQTQQQVAAEQAARSGDDDCVAECAESSGSRPFLTVGTIFSAASKLQQIGLIK